MNQVLTVEPGLLKSVLSGEFSLEEAQKAFVELIDEAGRHQLKKVLVDGRDLLGEPSTIERFYYGSFASDEAHKLSWHIVFAYVLLPPVLDPEAFGETVARNRGMAVRTFEDPEAARQWLSMSPRDTSA